jgi:hypothetical protein
LKRHGVSFLKLQKKGLISDARVLTSEEVGSDNENAIFFNPAAQRIPQAAIFLAACRC